MNGLLSSTPAPQGLNLQTKPEGFFPWKPQRDVRRRIGIPLTPEEEAQIASSSALDLPSDPNLTEEENEQLKQSAVQVLQNKALAEAEAEEAVKLGKIAAEKDPEKLEGYREEGYELSVDQQRILWDVEQQKPLTQKTGEFLSAIGPAAVSMIADVGKGAYGLAKEGAVDIIGATGESNEYGEKQLAEAGNAWRSFGSGVVGGLEDIIVNLPKTMIAGGTPITDYIAERFGRSPDKSFENFLAREDVRRQLAEENQQYPERTSRLLQRWGNILGFDNFAEEIAANALTADEINPNIAVLGDVLAFDLPFTSAVSRVAAKPITKAGETAAGAIVGRELGGVRLGVAPTVAATGRAVRKGGEKVDEIAGRIDQYFTGSSDWLFRNAIGKTARLVTKPAAAVEAIGELGVDIGRATDLGWAGRKGVFERIGTSPESGVIANTFFGDRSKLSIRKIGPMTPEEVAKNAERLGSQLEKNSKAGLRRARALDSVSRLTQYYTNAGISGAAVQAVLGLPNLETWGAAGEMVGSGIGIGAMSASAPGAVFGARVAMDQRRAAEADIRRMYEERLDEKTKKKLAEFSDPTERLEGRLAFLQMRKELLDEIIKSGQSYQDGDVNINPQEAEAELFQINEEFIPSIQGQLEAFKAGGKRSQEEIQFLINKEFMDTLGNLQITADKAGLGGNVNVQLATTEEIAAAMREIYAPLQKQAQETVQALEGQENISPDDAVRLQQAKEALAKIDQEIRINPTNRGTALSPNSAPVAVPTMFINSDRIQSAQGRDLPRVMRHEMFHVLLQFKEFQELTKPYTDKLFDQYVMNINGQMEKVGDGMISDQALLARADLYSKAYDPLNEALWKEQFETQEDLKNSIKEEFLAELFGFSGGELGMTSQIEDSAVQNFIDMVRTKESGSTIGRIRDLLKKIGVTTTDEGVVSDVVGELPSEAISLIRQLRRELRDSSGAFTYEGDPNLNTQGSYTFAQIAASPALRKRYEGADFWATEAAATIYGPDGKVLSDSVLNKRQANQAKVGEWIVQGGVLTPVDPANGPAPRNLMIAAKGQPDGTKIVVGVRTAKDAEGKPKVLSQSAVEAASRQRGRMIRNAFDNAPDDGSPNRLRDTGNGNYRGTLSPSQVEAINAIPDIILPPSMKRLITDINNTLEKGDGTRNTIEYQAALRGGKYRGMAPRISDEVFIGFQFSKQDNFLVTSVSVTRLNNKIDSWLKDKPQRLSLWGGSKYDMWTDFRRYLINHQQGLPGNTNLSTDPAVAEAKKNVLNDLLNLYNKETEAANPDRTKSRTRRGQDSVDRTIASRRLDRILQMEQNTGDKLPLNYGKIISNALPQDVSGETVYRGATIDQYRDEGSYFGDEKYGKPVIATYVTPSQILAKTYAERGEEAFEEFEDANDWEGAEDARREAQPIITKFLLKKGNLFSGKDPKDLEKLGKVLKQNGVSEAEERKILKGVQNETSSWSELEEISQLISKAGFDGYVAYERGIPTYAMFGKMSKYGEVTDELDLDGDSILGGGKNLISEINLQNYQDRGMADGQWSEARTFLNKYQLSLREAVLLKKLIDKKYPRQSSEVKNGDLTETGKNLKRKREDLVKEIFGIKDGEKNDIGYTMSNHNLGVLEDIDYDLGDLLYNIIYDNDGKLFRDSPGKKTNLKPVQILPPEISKTILSSLTKKELDLLKNEFISGKIYTDESKFVKKFNPSDKKSQQELLAEFKSLNKYVPPKISWGSKALPALPEGRATYFQFFDLHKKGGSMKTGELVIKVEADSPEEALRLIRKDPEYADAAARANIIPTSEVEALTPEEDLWRPEIESKALPETLFRAGSFNEAPGRGVFLTSRPNTAESYSREGQREVSSYKLPEDANLFDAENRWKLVSEIDPKWDKEKVYDQEVKKGMIGDSSPEQRLEAEAEKRIKKILSEIGYDGVRYSGGVTDQAGEFQIFNPNLLEKADKAPASKALPDIANRSDLDDAVASKLTRKGVRDPNIRDWFMKSYIKEFLQAPLLKNVPNFGDKTVGDDIVRDRAILDDYYAWPNDPEWKKKEGMQRFGSFTLAEGDWIDHVIDYMNTLPESEKKKLYKQTRAQIDEKVVEWSEKMANKKVSQLKNIEIGKDIKPVKKFPDGYSVVELLSDGAYKEEGDAMGHCVGGYCSESDTYNKYRKIYSLRDPDGNPHATIEVVKDLEDYAQEEIRKSVRAYKAENPDARVDEDWAMDTFGDDVYQEIFGELDPYAYAESDKRAIVMQIKGKANSKVPEKYAKYVREFFKSGPGKKMGILADGENIGLKPRARNFGVSNRMIYPDTKQEISPEDSSLWDSGDRYIVSEESESKLSKPSSKALPAAIFGDFYHGTDSDIARKIDRGSEFSASSYGEYKSVKVIYVSPSKEGAMEFSGNEIDGILSTKLRNRNIFNPADKGDTKKLIDALVPYMEIYDSDLTEKQLQKEAERMAKEIANEISGEGRDKDSGWQEVERYADVIKEAGFDGYVAWEDGNPMIGFYPDKIEYNFKKLPEPPLGTVKL